MPRSGNSIQQNMQARNNEKLKDLMSAWLDDQEYQARYTLAEFTGLSLELRTEEIVRAQIANWEAVLLGIAYLRNNLHPRDPDSSHFKGFQADGSS